MNNIKILSLGFIIGFILLSGLLEQTAKAQLSKIPPGGPFLPVQPKGACRMDPSITFTKEQAEKLAHLQRAYKEEAKPLWGEMRNLRIGLRFAVSDPQVPPQAFLDKQWRFSALQARLENLLFSYQVKARAILTKEQLERLPQDCPSKMGTGYAVGKGLGRVPRKGIRQGGEKR
ncbi:MAG: hypothetical protein H6Q42_1554 [Deltaproteobacteria bacterium]|jgi:hypothetical protein|nr:hypothetical protein [Deltaproteobacteria bacterium]